MLVKFLPWIVLIFAVYYLWQNFTPWPFGGKEEASQVLEQHTVLESIESLGKLELVKYNFQEITELTEKNDRYLGIFPTEDSKAILISNGEAAGCIDLMKITANDIMLQGDSLIVTLPEPEICYYKLNLKKTELYAVEKGVYYKDEGALISKAYRLAEKEIKEAALNSGILDKTLENAEIILQPFLEEIVHKKVYFRHQIVKEEIRNY